MQKRLMFIAGAGLGYVLGARAGQGRYQQIKSQADSVWNDPRVQEKVSLATEAVKEKAPVVQAKAQEAAAAAQAKAQDAAGAAQVKAQGAAAAAKAKVTGDHSGNQIGVESSSDVEPQTVKYESGR
ncbi:MULTISPECIES: hypothetical protein [Arsenicicoccus]|uniref:YtxH domain-containing protein n=1 Tax=Arsenicicoccus bolidensis TaxID=229480 RepID=A0ABS9PY48_9MICO|nr:MULTISPECIES: hypothetical protein [Arsenicicoccus]MCG7320552.1 YtxH domain-containing protein [Arsenicicoccus bolidensis]